MFGLGSSEILLILIIGFVLFILPYCKIFAKAGFSRWLGLLMVIPIVNIGLLFFFAFTKWPIHNELENLKRSSKESGNL